MDSNEKPKGLCADVRISSDRTKKNITVSGDITAKDAKKIIQGYLPDFNSKFFLQTDITAIPDGYSVNIYGRQSVKDYLSENRYVSCVDIFSVCNAVKEIIKKYGKNVFCDTLFDYNAVFIENEDIKQLNFILVPFLHSDKKHMSFRDFVHILFIHMTENDTDAEENVIRLLNVITEWESSGYKDALFGKYVMCIDSFFEKNQKNSKKDLIAKGTKVIKQFVGNIHIEKKDIKDGMVYISLLCDKPKMQYSFAYDKNKDVFLRLDKNKSHDESIYSCVKIGRDRSWADIHIADMTVSGQFGTIYYSKNRFYLRNGIGIAGDFNVDSFDKNTCEIKDRQSLLIGRLRCTARVGKYNF